MKNALLQRLGIEHPVLLSPMAGGPGTAELGAAVSNAGGLGALGVAYLSPEHILEEIRRTRALTRGPINVNLFAGGHPASPPAFDAAPMLEILGEVHASLGLPAPVLPAFPRNPFVEQYQAVLEARPEVLSFTFGLLDRPLVAQLHARGIAVLGTATTLEEAKMLAESGVDAVVAQGSEAGAHRGTFAGPFETSLVPIAQLVREIAPFASVIASGGIMDGAEIRAMLDLGAMATQLGTAFLPCAESGASPVYKEALLAAKSDTTVITRAYSGRPARGLRNDFMAMLEGREDTILPFPLQNALTKAMRTAAGRMGRAGFLSLWAGQGVTRCRVRTPSELVTSYLV